MVTGEERHTVNIVVLALLTPLEFAGRPLILLVVDVIGRDGVNLLNRGHFWYGLELEEGSCTLYGGGKIRASCMLYSGSTSSPHDR